uniref:HTH APSES-type domain-containing protein n=1 Tax=Bionectria ochroleuca TaxID=29856 RepID=A0A0B7JH82_BIOOC
MIPGLDQQPFPRKKKSRDSSDLTYTKPQGVIKYPPFESLDREAYSQIQNFGIYPFGEIGQYCAHIPYSSDKKDVFEKTGRESFHVFVYRFTDPSDNRAYDVMWDYVGGFVRISPFFKSRGHKKHKTGPAKMLDLNKGLRDVTFHMTGGNRVAQGYWVPYQCARAVCATFCYPIAGALIPIFGPTFPDDCIRPGTTLFGRMVIDELSALRRDRPVTRVKAINQPNTLDRDQSKI